MRLLRLNQELSGIELSAYFWGWGEPGGGAHGLAVPQSCVARHNKVVVAAWAGTIPGVRMGATRQPNCSAVFVVVDPAALLRFAEARRADFALGVLSPSGVQW